MTLGEMIKEYLRDNTMTDFSKESGISRAYAYMLIKNKNNDGGEIVPSIETVKKVARGIHMPFDEVIARLDENITVGIRSDNNAQSSPSSLVSLSPDEFSLLEDYRELNSLGREKAREYIEDLKVNDKYTVKGEISSELSTG